MATKESILRELTHTANCIDDLKTQINDSTTLFMNDGAAQEKIQKLHHDIYRFIDAIVDTKRIVTENYEQMKADQLTINMVELEGYLRSIKDLEVLIEAVFPAFVKEKSEITNTHYASTLYDDFTV